MIVLFLNLHKSDEEGAIKFNRYYSIVTRILKQSIYYGTYYEQYIRTCNNIEDLLYDQLQRSGCEKAKQKFKSVSYVFIDGPVNRRPWSSQLNDVALLIRNCVKQNKKVHFNGFGHTALYYYLTTGFDKQYCIGRKGDKVTGKQDYFYEQETGDLYAHGKRICNSGIQVHRNNNRFFHTKSHQALENGAVLATKFHYLAFNSKNGDGLINNIVFPFSFYEKSKVFCVPADRTRANITTIIQTQDKVPIVFVHNNALSTHLVCPETLKVLINWLTEGQEIKALRRVVVKETENLSQMAFDNNLSSMRNTKNFKTKDMMLPVATDMSFKNKIMRPQTATSSKSKPKFEFDKPSIRCSGPYETEQHAKTIEGMNSKSKFLGRSRMVFKTEMQKNEIQNYVQRTPSRPPSAHNFRQINKNKWLDKKTFFVT